MLRLAIARSNASLEQGLRHGVSRQWQLQRLQQPLAVGSAREVMAECRIYQAKHDQQRTFADTKLPDKTVLPGSQSKDVAGVPQPPILDPATPSLASTEIPAHEAPKVPPTPAEVQSTLSPSSAGLSPTAPAAVRSSPPKKRRTFRSFILTLVLLSTLGYAGGVYYSLVNDNFHDFFTEYVPLGEDAVAYFEEREFRKRFPASGSASGKTWPQTRGENKVTIGRSSGVNARVADATNEGSDLGQKGRHLSAVDESAAPPKPAKTQEKTEAKGSSKAAPAAPVTKSADTASPKAPAASLVDHLNVSEATEPVVQDLVKMVNNIITAVNASPEASKYSSTLNTAKSDLDKIIGEITTLKAAANGEAESKITALHKQFDNAAEELYKRLEGEIRDHESRMRAEYESERERIIRGYEQKLSIEMDAANKVAEEKQQNALLQLEIALQQKFTDSVKSRVEAEREGRLSKLNELSSSVGELEQLTGEWNTVVDATLQTQHLQVALAAVRAKLQAADLPTPFINELVALKEVSKDNEVVSAAIASINPIAYQRGIPSAAALIDRFRRVAAEVRRASLLPEDAGVASHVASAVLSRFMFQKKSERGLPEGDDVEATLARTEVLLEEGDLDSAAREMNGLKGWAGVLSRDWVGECRRILEVQQAIDVISSEARLQSLLVD